MEANELRIGNIVNIGKEVNIIELCDFVDIYKNDTLKIYEPIPLTEELLIKFGFGKSDEHEMGNNTNDNFGLYYDYHFNKFRLETNESSGLNSTDINLDIKYVHQLQNLYFALTNEELTFKE